MNLACAMRAPGPMIDAMALRIEAACGQASHETDPFKKQG